MNAAQVIYTAPPLEDHPDCLLEVQVRAIMRQIPRSEGGRIIASNHGCLSIFNIQTCWMKEANHANR